MYVFRRNKWNVYFLFNFIEMMVDFPIATVYNLYIKDSQHCAIANRKHFKSIQTLNIQEGVSWLLTTKRTFSLMTN